jgi:hypothetical protein
MNKERLMFLENNIKAKNDFVDTKIIESMHSEAGDIQHGNTTYPNNAAGLMPILASVAPSDSTSQCNYRTREDFGATGMPSVASAEISYGEGLGGTLSQLAI